VARHHYTPWPAGSEELYDLAVEVSFSDCGPDLPGIFDMMAQRALGHELSVEGGFGSQSNIPLAKLCKSHEVTRPFETCERVRDIRNRRPAFTRSAYRLSFSKSAGEGCEVSLISTAGGIALKVEVFAPKRFRERRLPALTRPKKGHGRQLAKPRAHEAGDATVSPTLYIEISSILQDGRTAPIMAGRAVRR